MMVRLLFTFGVMLATFGVLGLIGYCSGLGIFGPGAVEYVFNLDLASAAGAGLIAWSKGKPVEAPNSLMPI